MANEHLASYLNDHLGGSVVGLELLDFLRSISRDAALQHAFAELHDDIAADRRELETLMSQLNVSQSGLRKAAAWMTEKLTQLKLRLDEPVGRDFRLFEALEALSLGIEGKRLMWRALASHAADRSQSQGVDLDRLQRRAEEQRARVESARIKAAQDVFDT